MQLQEGAVYIVERNQRNEKDKFQKKFEAVYKGKINKLHLFKHKGSYIECFSEHSIESKEIKIKEKEKKRC